MSCPKGEYYCRTSGKCKSIPAGHKVTADGDLIKEDKKKSYGDIITQNANEFGNTLNKSKQVKRFKNTVQDFGKTGNINIKSLVNNNKDLPDFLKNTGKKALVKTLQGLTTKLKTEQYSDWRSEFEIEEGKKKGLDGKACWDGYKLAGTKKKGGKTVDNCVKEDQVDEGIINSIKDKLNFVKYAKDTVNNYNNKLRKNSNAINEIIPGTAKVSEEVEGGISVQNYADGVQFNEIETVDIIKTKPLDPSNWRSELK